MAEDTRTDNTGETMAANDADRPGDDRLWGGRFAAGWADVMERINASIGFDKRLYKQDLAGSRAHCNMLVA